MTRHYPDLGSVSDWLCREGYLLQPIKSTTQIWVVTRHQYGISYSRSSDRRHFAWKTAIASHNVGFFLRLLDRFVTLILDLNGIGL